MQCAGLDAVRTIDVRYGRAAISGGRFPANSADLSLRNSGTVHSLVPVSGRSLAFKEAADSKTTPPTE